MTEHCDAKELETNDFGSKVAGIAGFVLLFVFGGSWLYNTELSSAIIVQGSVDIMGEAKSVQHRDGGVVSSILVEPGQEVKKGELLIQLDVTEHRIRAGANVTKKSHLNARLNRLYAERETRSPTLENTTALRPTKISTQIDEQTDSHELALKRMREANRKTRQLQGQSKLKQLENRVLGLEAQIESKRAEHQILKEELAAKKHLFSEGYSSLAAVREVQKAISVILGNISALTSEKAGIEHNLEEIRFSILNEGITFQENVLSEIISIEGEIREIDKNLMTDKTIIDRAAIRAPSSGVVHKMEVFTIGGVIKPSQELMQIVPENSALEIEASLETRYVDDIHKNQSAVVRMSGFDARTTPELNAQVSSISPDIIIDPQTGAPYYQLKVMVPPEELKKLNVTKLVPGMPVEIFINTGERTAFQYLTEPLMGQIRRAFRD